MTRTRRSLWSLIAGYGSSCIAMLIGFVSTPILLDYLGDARVGLYRIAIGWLGYTVLFELGLASTLQVLLSKAHGTGDRAATVQILRRGNRAYVLVAMASAILTAIFIAIAPYLSRDIPPELVVELRWGFAISLIGLLLLPLTPFRSLAESQQRSYFVHLAGTVQQIVVFALSIGFAVLAFGLIGQFAAALIGSIIAILILTRDGMRRFPEIIQRDTNRKAGTAIPMISGAMFAYHLAARICYTADTIVIGLMLGAEAALIYTVSLRLSQLALAQVLAVGNATWAALADLHHRGQIARFNERLVELTRIVGWLGCAVLIPVTIWNSDFLSVWVGEARYAGGTLNWLMLVASYALSITALWGWPLMATGRVRAVLPFFVTGGILNVIVSIILTYTHGLIGPAIGAVANLVGVVGWWCPLVLRREFGTPLRPLFSAVVWPVLLALPFGGLLVFVQDCWPIAGMPWPRALKFVVLAGCMGGAALIYLIVGWRCLFAPETRASLSARIFPKRGAK